VAALVLRLARHRRGGTRPEGWQDCGAGEGMKERVKQSSGDKGQGEVRRVGPQVKAISFSLNIFVWSWPACHGYVIQTLFSYF